LELMMLKAKIAEETTLYLLEKLGYVPDQDSVEWEDEYRRRFAIARAQLEATPRQGGSVAEPVAPTAQRPIQKTELPELLGPAAAVRWATALRQERLKDIQDDETKDFLGRSWTAAKSWIDTRELPPAAFLRRIEAQLAQHRRQIEDQEAALNAQRQAQAEAEAALAKEIEAAGITARGLIELVDVSPRAKPLPARAKLAELKADDRRLRIFETTHPPALLVLESAASGRIEYGIERDDGLVADLKLFARTATP
jgi:hypothetical protein